MAMSMQRRSAAVQSAGRRAAPAPRRVLVAPVQASAKLIDGKQVAEDIRKEINAKVVELKAKYNQVPGLAVVLVGGRKDSETYVRSKKKACAEAGIDSYGTDLPEDVSEDELLKVIMFCRLGWAGRRGAWGQGVSGCTMSACTRLPMC